MPRNPLTYNSLPNIWQGSLWAETDFMHTIFFTTTSSSGAHPASYPMGNRGYSTGDKVAGAES